jgi:hypothetical protein
LQNYPNPFNPSTSIVVSLPDNSNIKLTVYNLLGEVVGIISEGFFPAGKYSFEFNGDSAGGGLPSGIYVYELKTDNAVLRNKMILQK